MGKEYVPLSTAKEKQIVFIMLSVQRQDYNLTMRVCEGENAKRKKGEGGRDKGMEEEKSKSIHNGYIHIMGHVNNKNNAFCMHFNKNVQILK